MTVMAYEIIITLKNSSHLEWRVGLSDTILKGTHPGTIYARLGPYIDASCQVWLHLQYCQVSDAGSVG
jgi:hypothetical protein